MTDKKNTEDKKQEVNVVEKIIENQAREIRLKEREQDVKLAEIQANKELAYKNIEAQEKVMISNGSKEVQRLFIRVAAIVVSLISFLGLIAFAIIHDAKDIVIEIIKYVTPLFIGSFGGFYYGRNKGRKEVEKG